MTEDLTAAIDALVCLFCAGEGVTAHRITHTRYGLLEAVFGQRLCPSCGGSGLRPSAHTP